MSKIYDTKDTTESIPFNNDSIDFKSETAQEAIEEASKRSEDSGVVHATGEVQTTSTNDVPLQGMSVTPPAGTYIIHGHFLGRHFKNNGILWGSLYVGSTQIPNTLYNVNVARRGVTATWSMKAEITVDGSQVIQIRWRSQTGTARVFGRFLSYMRKK